MLWLAYTKGKQTYRQLADNYGCSVKTIQRRLDTLSESPSTSQPGAVLPEISVPSDLSSGLFLLMDTTYWGRNFGVMVFRDVATGRIVWKHYVRQETNALYVQGIDTIVAMGYKVRAVVCDGRRGLIEALNAQAIVVQMCQFHQLAIIRRYLGKHPLSEAARSLIALAKTMTRCTKAAFEAGLASWYQQYEAVVNLRQHDHAHRLRYVHRRLRSAYRSLLRNLSWLFSFEQPGLRIKSGHGRYGLPNTTNALDGLFADLKNKLRCHNGLSLRRKQRFIDEFFAGIRQDGQ